MIHRLASGDDDDVRKSLKRRKPNYDDDESFDGSSSDESTQGADCKQGKGDEKVILPRSVIGKVIKNVSDGIRVSGDSREVILLCCHEFIHTLSSRASRLCEMQHKKLIGADHVVTALKNMGLSSYIKECQETMSAAVEEAAEKRRRMSKEVCSQGWSEDDLYRHQMELFAQAKEQVQAVYCNTMPTTQSSASAGDDTSTTVPNNMPTCSSSSQQNKQRTATIQVATCATSAGHAQCSSAPFNIDNMIRLMKPTKATAADHHDDGGGGGGGDAEEDYDAEEDDNGSG